jgi:hypothetical protein
MVLDLFRSWYLLAIRWRSGLDVYNLVGEEVIAYDYVFYILSIEVSP